MTEQEFEKVIQNALHTEIKPSRDSFGRMLNTLNDIPVTKNADMRYTMRTATFDIINNKITEIISFWQSKRIILVPSLILLLLIGAFSLSPHSSSNTYDTLSIQKLAEQDEAIEEEGPDYDDGIVFTSFDEPAIDDLSTTQNEI